MVINVIAIHGRALINTIIYVLLAIICILTINPLAAYALSHYRLKHTNKILLFLLATMAFPPSVGMIPNFLLLKDLGLLNTFMALLVSVLANGYSIFLLKGFFDSLPAEIYEAPLIDDASEMDIFAKLALPMTTPEANAEFCKKMADTGVDAVVAINCLMAQENDTDEKVL